MKRNLTLGSVGKRGSLTQGLCGSVLERGSEGVGTRNGTWYRENRSLDRYWI